MTHTRTSPATHGTRMIQLRHIQRDGAERTIALAAHVATP